MPESASGGHERFLSDLPQVPWLERYDENYFAQYSIVAAALECIRADYPLACTTSACLLGLSIRWINSI